MAPTLTRRSALLACVATGLVGCAGEQEDVVPGLSGPARSTKPDPTGRPRGVRAVTPQHLAIPSIGVSTRLVGLGLHEDGTVEVPSVPETAGWFRLGTVPGQRGSSVILGHVDSLDGPGVFAYLSALRRPDRVQVMLSDDSLVTFEVTGIETYANADFPADLVYAGTRRRRELNLVTCGGEYDSTQGGYQSNVVVFARRTRT